MCARGDRAGGQGVSSGLRSGPSRCPRPTTCRAPSGSARRGVAEQTRLRAVMDRSDQSPDASPQPSLVADERAHANPVARDLDHLVGGQEPGTSLQDDDARSGLTHSAAGDVVGRRPGARSQAQDEPPTEHHEPPDRRGCLLGYRSTRRSEASVMTGARLLPTGPKSSVPAPAASVTQGDTLRPRSRDAVVARSLD